MREVSLEPRHLQKIIELVRNRFSQGEIYIYGSRATGRNRKYSDVDIALKANEKIDADIIYKLLNDFEDSIFPYTVDIIDLNNISDRFYNLIKDDLILIYSHPVP